MTPNKTQLLTLADVVEGLPAKWTVEYRAVAKEIHRALFGAPDIANSGYGWREDDSGWWMMTGSDARTPPERIDPEPWLTSLDAAIQLVPADWHLNLQGVNDSWWCCLTHTPSRSIDSVTSITTIPALSVTAASLRALAAGCE